VSARVRRVLGTAALVAALAGAVPALGASGVGTPSGFTFVGHEAVEPGVDHYLMRSGDPQHAVHVARIDAALADRLRVMRSRDRIAGPFPRLERTSSMCLRVRCVVAVNGDFTEPGTQEPAGPIVSAGELMRTPRFRHARFSIDASGRPTIGHDLDWSGTVRVIDDELALTGVNVPRPADGVVLYTSRYGPSTGTPADGRELALEVAGPPSGNQTPVRLVRLATGDSPLGPGRLVVSGTGAGAAAIEALWRRWRLADPAALGVLDVDTRGIVEAVGGSPVLVLGSQWAFPDHDDSFTRSAHPRTVIGWTAAGDFLLVAVDGRQPGYSTGMSLHSAASLLIQLGAIEAVNLDGGGSTTFVVKSQVRNRPSNPGNAERSVGSALVLLPAPGSVGVADPRGIALACPDGRVPDDGFADVAAGSGHETAVDCVVWWEVARGVTAELFEPGRTVTRAQLASLLASFVTRSGGTLPASQDRFRDDAGSPHERSINQVAAAGIMTGRGDGSFGPSLHVTRAQLASALARAVAHRQGGPLPPAVDYFADDDSSAHEPAIDQAAAAGLVGGVSLNLYGPGDAVRRDQLATTLARALDLLVEQGTTTAP
jgi:hypothetical protein